MELDLPEGEELGGSLGNWLGPLLRLLLGDVFGRKEGFDLELELGNEVGHTLGDLLRSILGKELGCTDGDFFGVCCDRLSFLKQHFF